MHFAASLRVSPTAAAAIAVVVAAACACDRATVAADHAASTVSSTSTATSTATETSSLWGTGLYAKGGTIAEGNHAFVPQYPLWSDGASKRRWIWLPPGSTIEASNPDVWVFPVGTKLWKEFSFAQRRVETRFMERTPSGWRFATYVWNERQDDATLASARGASTAVTVAPGLTHQIPSEADCRVCHGSQPVLGFSALQLSVDRDPNAPHREDATHASVDLARLVARGWLRGFSGTTSPRIAARSATERAALGYLHANCGSCHREGSPLSSLHMVLASSMASSRVSTVVATTHGVASQVDATRQRIAPGRPEASVLFERVSSRVPAVQMPPLGTQVVDEAAVGLLRTWIRETSAEPLGE